MPGTCPPPHGTLRMPGAFGESAGIKTGTLGEAHCTAGQQPLPSNSKPPNLSQRENLFGNSLGNKTWPYLIWTHLAAKPDLSWQELLIISIFALKYKWSRISLWKYVCLIHGGCHWEWYILDSVYSMIPFQTLKISEFWNSPEFWNLQAFQEKSWGPIL